MPGAIVTVTQLDRAAVTASAEDGAFRFANLPDGIWQEYCVADTPINTSLTVQRLPVEADGFVAVPTAPGLGVDLDEDVLESLRIDG